jgi:hypothetical protein
LRGVDPSTIGERPTLHAASRAAHDEDSVPAVHLDLDWEDRRRASTPLHDKKEVPPMNHSRTKKQLRVSDIVIFIAVVGTILGGLFTL